jgi:hypothetical protein
LCNYKNYLKIIDNLNIPLNQEISSTQLKKLISKKVKSVSVSESIAIDMKHSHNESMIKSNEKSLIGLDHLNSLASGKVLKNVAFKSCLNSQQLGQQNYPSQIQDECCPKCIQTAEFFLQ